MMTTTLKMLITLYLKIMMMVLKMVSLPQKITIIVKMEFISLKIMIQKMVFTLLKITIVKMVFYQKITIQKMVSSVKITILKTEF